MSSDPRRPIALVEPIATAIAEQLAPYCDKIAIAGSIRRRVDLVGDVELVVIPTRRQQAVALPGFEPSAAARSALKAGIVDELDECLNQWLIRGQVRQRRDRRGRTFWGPSDKRLLWRHGPSADDWIAVDVTGATAATWGTRLLIRTGPAELSHRLVTYRKAGGLLHPDLKFADGGLYQHFPDVGWRFIPTPDEETAIAILRLPYVAPEHRFSTTYGDQLVGPRP